MFGGMSSFASLLRLEQCIAPFVLFQLRFEAAVKVMLAVFVADVVYVFVSLLLWFWMA